MPRIESDIKTADDFVGAFEEFQDLAKEQVDKVGDQMTELIKSKGVKAEKTDLESSDDGGFMIMVDPSDIEKAERLGLRDTVAQSMLIMIKQRMISEFG